MPRLSKIRLTGCKYEGLQKEHENSIFDLNKNDKADHTLFTLCNGGGKGVMMQLIFQLLLPETTWGKNNGNKVISMFYDQRSILQQVTFHVVLEWILDTVPEKRLITGIAVKSIIKNTSSEDENSTGLSYCLYTHEHDNKGPFTVENLPLYDKRTKEAVEIDLVEDFLNSNKRDFIKYSKSSAKRSDSDYYNYLANRGIHRSEWLKLKEINKSEGGVGDYFTGASDNKSIFDKIIIPAISENIKNYSYGQGDNLIEMFKSNLSITKDLPILMKREGDYRELLSEIKPLIQNTDIGIRYLDIKDRLISQGNDIYFVLNDEYLFTDKEIKKWEVELKKSKSERADLLYKIDNLNYNSEKRNMESKEIDMETLSQELKEKTIDIESKTKEKNQYRVNKAVYQKKKVENDIENKTKEKEKLIQALDLSDTKERAEYLDREIDDEFQKTKEVWVGIEDQYAAYKNYNQDLKSANNDKKKKYTKKIEVLQNKVNIFSLKEEELDRMKKKLGEDYDALSLTFPERILEDLMLLKEKTLIKMESLSDEINAYNKKLSQVHIEIVKLEYEVENKDKTIKSLEKTVKEEEKLELELSKKIARLLMENQEGGLLSHNYFNKKLDSLELLKLEKNINLESVQRNIWEQNIDKLLNKEDYFIANKDIVAIKEEIKKLNIDVQTGPEFLNEMYQEDKTPLLNDNPAFIYSLVIASTRDWDIIEKNIGEDLFINNMVPIYIRSEMRESRADNFKSIKGRAHKLIDREEFISWTSEMENRISSLIQTEKNIKDDLYNIDEVIHEIKTISKKDTALILNQKIKNEKDERSNLLEKTRSLEEEKLMSENKVNDSENILKKNREKLETIYISINSIERYIERKNEIEIENMEIKELKKEILGLKEDILIVEEDTDRINESLDLTRDSYYDWKRAIGLVIEDIKSLYKDISYEYSVSENYSNYRIPDFISVENRLKSLLGERKIIEENINTKNASIAVINVEIEGLSKDRDRYISELGEIDREWSKFEYLGLSLNEIHIRLSGVKKEIKILQEKKDGIKSDFDVIRGSIESMKKQVANIENNILNTHKRSAVSLELDDINDEIDNVNRDIQSNKRYLHNCEEVLDRNNQNKFKYHLNLNNIKNGYPLEVAKGKTDKILRDKVETDPDLIVEDWLRDCGNNRMRINETIEAGQRIRDRFIKVVLSKLEEVDLREKISSAIKEVDISKFKNNMTSFDSMEKNFENELLSLSKEKDKAEEAMKQWTNRAAMHVIKMLEALDNMITSMNYINEKGNAFPLVKLKGKDRIPRDKSEIIHLLEEYFIQSIAKVVEKNTDIYKMNDKELRDIMGDRVIFAKALQGRYPTLMVYKMSEKNEFRYAKAREEYYTTWEAINKGEGDQPEGSGGQTLSVNTFVVMMIMNFKNKHIGNENPSTVLILDNPFGKASAKHVLDPIFEIADRLNFQLICFAAPEIIKVEISERFPVFWELRPENGKIVHGGRVVK